jgi:hypothetical protein
MALTQQATERYAPGEDISCVATAAITAERFVVISAAHNKSLGENIKVAQATVSGVAVFGVAMYDAAIGDVVKIRPISGGSVMGVYAGAALTAGQEIQTDAAGKAIPLAAGKSCGMAVNDAAINTTADVSLGR